MTSAVTQAQSHQDKFQQFQHDRVDSAAADLNEHLKQLSTLASTKWITAFGALDAKADDPAKLHRLVTELKAHIADTPVSVAPVVRAAVQDAHKLAAAYANSTLRKPVKVKPPQVDGDAITGIEDKMTHHLTMAQSLLDAVTDDAVFDDDITPVLSVASQSALDLTRGMSWMMTTQATATVQQVADTAGVGWVVIGERGACLQCQAQIGLTDQDTSEQPPYHPHCACTIQPYNHAATAAGGTSFSDALQREAERSVASGWSDYDSTAAKVRAADALIKAGTDLPKSVVKRAERAVRSGSF